jgi:hypothetical protein
VSGTADFSLVPGTAKAQGIVEADELTRSSPIISATFFATEDPDSIYIEFELSMVCKDETGEERGEALLKVTGGCEWDESDDYFSSIRPTEISLEYLDPSPITGHLSRRYHYAEGHMGRRRTSHDQAQAERVILGRVRSARHVGFVLGAWYQKAPVPPV